MKRRRGSIESMANARGICLVVHADSFSRGCNSERPFGRDSAFSSNILPTRLCHSFATQIENSYGSRCWIVGDAIAGYELRTYSCGTFSWDMRRCAHAHAQGFHPTLARDSNCSDWSCPTWGLSVEPELSSKYLQPIRTPGTFNRCIAHQDENHKRSAAILECQTATLIIWLNLKYLSL